MSLGTRTRDHRLGPPIARVDAAPIRATTADRGSSSLELVVIFPALLLLVFGLVQGALWYHARDVAIAAASEGAAVARSEAGTAQAGRARAAEFLAQNGDTVLGARVEASRSAMRVSVTVSGRSVSLLPGLAGPPVTQSVSGPVERFTSRGTS